MITDTQRLYLFLSAYCGSWRNSVYISTGGLGYLLSADWDCHPIVMTVEQFQQLSGEQIDPAKCCGQLTGAGFFAVHGNFTKKTALFSLFPVRNLYDSKIWTRS